MVNVSNKTVAKVANEAGISPSRHKGGRKQKLSESDKDYAAQLLTRGNASTIPELTKMIKTGLNMSISESTIRKCVKDRNIVARKKTKKPLLTKKHRQARLSWAIDHSEWTESDWMKVIWSDETKINRFGSDGNRWIWKQRGSPRTDRSFSPTVKFGGGSVMIWGCMAGYDIGRCVRIKGIMDSKMYVKIVEDHLLGTIEDHGLDRNKIRFQQDNDPKHTSKMAVKWFNDNKIKRIDWPSQSPDLNPIENLWNELKRALNNYPTRPTGVLELWDRIGVEWKRLDQEYALHLIRGMPKRIQQVIEAKGGPIMF